MLVRWTSTVLWVTKSACAISRLVGPSAASSATRRSLGVSDSTPLRAMRRRVAHAQGAPRRRAGGRRPYQPRDRASALRYPEDGRGPPHEHLSQARDQLARAARGRARRTGSRLDPLPSPARRLSSGRATKHCGSNLGAPTMRAPPRSSTIGSMFVHPFISRIGGGKC